jgi:DNA polymerase-3 subunit gamma/tau
MRWPGDGKTVVETSDTLRLNGLSAAGTLEEMSAVLQRMAVLQAVPGMAAVDESRPRRGGNRAAGALMPARRRNPAALQPVPARPASWAWRPMNTPALTMVLLRLLAFKPPPSTPLCARPRRPRPGKDGQAHGRHARPARRHEVPLLSRALSVQEVPSGARSPVPRRRSALPLWPGLSVPDLAPFALSLSPLPCPIPMPSTR